MRLLGVLIRHALRQLVSVDYREALFQELCAYLNGSRPRRVLEIGPKDGQDTHRLLRLEPETLTLIDLPQMRETNEKWLQDIDRSRIQYMSANFMYSEAVAELLETYDCVWCTGVLYHNPEQLRMIGRLYDVLKPGGVLVLESAVTRRRKLRNENCVEIIYPPSETQKRRYHLSTNVTHLPSARAVASWLAMVGFQRIVPSAYYQKVYARLVRRGAAYMATKPLDRRVGTYYSFAGDEGYEIGKAL